ncbi:hypothetical protein [Pseudolysinimonas yzui]|jgi:hypothetical protein|uniref:YtxH domain-containing protein n=1 Tax=Pseudolysinimonas yzui TaxID=2708254 RepID=A0A8J3LZ38_9MICO|nr:hypothetical protein [Pseudolysinimonas yzui]GHF08767.1 hypothetical protein GCM10011600_07050 [Pseudolysinimonas yzui]
MKGLLLLTVGVAAGFAIAHQVSKTPEGQKFFAEVDKKAKDFSDAVVQGYKSREAELKQTVAEATGVVSDLSARARAAAK